MKIDAYFVVLSCIYIRCTIYMSDIDVVYMLCHILALSTPSRFHIILNVKKIHFLNSLLILTSQFNIPDAVTHTVQEGMLSSLTLDIA